MTPCTCAVENYAGYADTRLVANLESYGAAQVDPSLQDPWGMAFGPTTPVWISNTLSGKMTVYDGSGTLHLTVPTADLLVGMIYNPASSDFVINKPNATSASASFIASSLTGKLWAWAPSLGAVMVSSRTGAYLGLAYGTNGTNSFLYVPDFENGVVTVFDTHFNVANFGSNAFVDPNPLPLYAPFSTYNILGDIWVAYAMINTTSFEEVTGENKGYVSVFSPTGEFIRRFATDGMLDAPWGIALAPQTFGDLAGTLLIGNFGNGMINAYDYRSGAWLATLSDASGNPIVIDGLWALGFGNGRAGQSTSSLFYTAGPNHEVDGIYGRLDPNMP